MVYGPVKFRERTQRRIFHATLAFGRECTCPEQPGTYKNGAGRRLLLLERGGGRVHFLFQRWDNYFCDLKIRAAPALLVLVEILSLEAQPKKVNF